jgi:hypothetical protein
MTLLTGAPLEDEREDNAAGTLERSGSSELD